MEFARTSMIHAVAPHFLWPFAVRYAAHQLNLWPRVSLPETSPTLRWTGEVGDASVFRVWESRAFVRDTSADKLSPRAIPCDVTFDESVPFYRLFPYRSAPPPPRPLFLARGPPPVDHLPPEGPAPSGEFQVDPLPGHAPIQVPVNSGAARGAASGGAEPGGAESEGAETGGVECEGVEPEDVETGGAETGGAEPGGAEPGGVATGGGEPGGAELEGVEPGGAASEGAESGGAEPQGATSTGGSVGASPRLSPQQLLAAGAGVTGGTAATGPGGARTDGVEGAGSRGARVCGPGAGGARVGGPSVGGAGAGGARAVDPGSTVRPRPYFVPLLQQVLGTPPSAALTPPLLCPPPDQSQPPLQPASPLPTPSPYNEQSGGLTERRELASRLVLPVRTAHCVPRSRPPPVPGTHAMTLRPSSVPLRVPLPAPPESSLLAVPDPDLLLRLLSLLSYLTFVAACRLDYATALVAKSASASPLSVGGECSLHTDVLEDKQEDFECLAAAVPHFASMLLAPEGDPDAPDIPTPRSYAEAITGPYSSQWQVAMDAEMASWKSTGTYVDEFPPPRANIVDGMWIFRVKRPPGSPPSFKARYVARGFSQRQGCDYKLHSLDFSKAFLQGSLHEEIWLRRPPGYTESFPASTPRSLRRSVYGLRQVPHEWHDTLRTTLGALGFAPATADPSLFLRTDTSLPPFYVLVYVNDLVFATADTKALTLVKLILQKRHTCTDLGPSALRLPVLLATAHSSVYQPLASAPPSDESVEPIGLYSELVGCLMYLMTCTRHDLAYPLSLLACYVAPGRHRKVHWDAAKRVMRYLCSTSGMGLVLGGRGPLFFSGHADASWVHNSATQQSSQGYTFSLGSGSVSWRSTRSSSVLSSICEAEIYVGAMAAQELRWLTYLLTDLGEKPRSPSILYVDNKAMIALCQEHRLEHRSKHIALRYFLARELQ
ncbi:unnamed protein product [Closterium sp. NIES-53]